MSRYKRLNIAGWSGLALEGFADQFDGRDPLAYFIAAPHEIIKRPPHKPTTTYRVELPPGAGSGGASEGAGEARGEHGGTVIVRHDRTGRPRWSLHTRGIHTLRIHDRLQRAGIETTHVLAAFHRRVENGRLEELVVTRYIENTNLLLPLNKRQPCSDERMAELLHRVGRLFRRLHDAGFIHGDPIPGNVLIGPDDTLLLIDNERTRHLGNLPYFFHRERRDNLMRLVARMLGQRPHKIVRRTLEGYYGVTGRPASRQIRREWLTVLRLAKIRAASLQNRAAAAKIKGGA